MNETIKDLKDIIEIHDLGFLYDDYNDLTKKYAKIDPLQLATYLYQCGYRKSVGKEKT